MKYYVLLLILNFHFSIFYSFSQGISINNFGNQADNSAMLDINSTSQGLLIPRMTISQRDAIISPALSLLIFNTTTNCFESYVNGAWYSVSCPKIANTCTDFGYISTIAGDGTWAYNGDGIPAVNASLGALMEVKVDVYGNVYIVDMGHSRIRKLTYSTGLISTIAGTGTNGYNGDGIPATTAQLNFPYGVAVDGIGNIYIGDVLNYRIRKVDAITGLISTFAGNGNPGSFGDGIPAINAQLSSPYGVAVDKEGNVYIGDYGGNRVREVDISTGIIHTIAGTGVGGYNGDGIPATSAELKVPFGVFIDDDGNVYIADSQNFRVRKVTKSTGLISTLAGTGVAGYNGEGIPATTAQLNNPSGVAVDRSGNVYIMAENSSRLFKISITDGLINTIAGNGTHGYNGDGIPATSAEFYYATGLAIDIYGNLYIGDQGNRRVRKVCN